MGRPQPNRASAVLATALGIAVVICRALLRQNVSVWILYVFYSLAAVLAIAYLICVFYLKDKKSTDDAEQRGDGYGK